MKQAARRTSVIIAAAMLGTAIASSPAIAAAPSAPNNCTAAPVAGGWKIDWERPTTSDSPIFRYAIRAEGQSDPTIRLDVRRGQENSVTTYTWTDTVARARSPLTFRVRAVSLDGAGAWCDAPVTGGATNETPTSPDGTVSDDATQPSTGVEPRVGVRVFPQYQDKTYGNHAEVLDALGRLGVDRVSGLLTPHMSSDEIAFYRDAHSRFGIKVWFAVGQPGDVLTDAEWADVRNILAGPLTGVAEVASGWNEPNHRVGEDWATATANHQAKLWENIQQVNVGSGQDIEVGTPPLWSGNISEQFSDLKLLAPKIQGAYDLINWHMYPHGETGAELAAMIDQQVAHFQAAYGSGYPMLNSESGYFTATSYTGGSNPSTYESQAREIDDLVALHLARGVDISYFELLDDPDPTESNREANFGLVETPGLDPATWFDKPAFAVFKTLTD